mmetsp:Transcript_8138/g.21543  ORF Transcript_8138/g.21543 Transcript_8138/m.21543 type:complete len:204 (-) Transcript_8138:2043-2654(-)|eukprot:CAMPEP_0113870972 /NCGR_PEP_ID=MMETSP0780_2-20120614/2381_1 /TAXON_ID=652834 /ORGANISM="Palpitomonas bilix" /LENGTH=203 /DNA_ID=CAMNT_0000856305 /DNA_START=105 /DNA_END=716 /DNA_ORIENTATION=- /assembly_acc=CAM_ASM_000599
MGLLPNPFADDEVEEGECLIEGLEESNTNGALPFFSDSRAEERSMKRKQMDEAKREDKKRRREEEEELAKKLNFPIRLETPEEIERWREDRRKNYPTAANIARKRKEEEERRKEAAEKRKEMQLKRKEGGQKVCKYFMHGKCRKGKKCPFLHVPHDKKGGALPAGQPATQTEHTFVRKLLAAELDLEKKYLLEAIRHLASVLD